MTQRIAVVQCGGPTPVFNASLYGVVSTLRRAGVEVWGVRGGGTGLVTGALAPIGPGPLDALLRLPGAALGAGRRALSADEIAEAARILHNRGIDGLVCLGGNGTMTLAQRLAETSRELGHGLGVVGVPKTVDNDLHGTDHAPGFPSAATFAAMAVEDLALDLAAMVGFEAVRVVEVMGRHSGWLAAAAGALHAPAIVCLPEVPLEKSALLARVEGTVRDRGSALVVVAEGVRDRTGQELGGLPVDRQGRTQVLGGAGAKVASIIRDALGVGVRSENLGLVPRCFSELATQRDRDEAEACGSAAAESLLGGARGVMIGIQRTTGKPGWVLRPVDLQEVAGRERPLPQAFRDLGPDWRAWIAPLLAPPTERPDRGFSVW